MKLPAYPRYKPSSVEWLGDVPEHWEVKRLDFLATVKARLGWKGLTASEYVPEGFIFLATPNIKGEGAIDFTNVNYITAERYYESPEIMVQIGDVLMAKDGSTLGTTNVVHHLPAPTTVNSSVAVLRPKPALNSSYFFRWLTSAYLQSLIQSMKDGQGVPHLFQADIRKFPMLLPPLTEQRAIAAFLDRETGRIDGLVAKKQELIERLKEKRTALISRTVTRGLPPAAARAAGLPENPPLKPSGIEWIGDIPAHWEVKKLSWLFRYAKGPSAAMLTKEYVADNVGDYPVFSGQTENEGLMGMIDWHEFNFAKPVIFVTTVGARAMTTRLVLGKFSLSQNCALIIPRTDSANPRFYEPLLHCLFDYERRSISLIMQPSLRFDDLDKFRVPLPLPREQAAIAAYLALETAKLDALLGKVEEAVERLQEYRSALITAAVTGKIDVREVVVP